METVQLSNQAMPNYSIKDTAQNIWDFLRFKSLREAMAFNFPLDFTEEDVKDIDTQIWV